MTTPVEIRHDFTMACPQLNTQDLLLCDDLSQLSDDQAKYVLPFLTNLLLNPSFTKRREIIRRIYKYRKANDVIQLLQAKIIEPADLHCPPPPDAFESSNPSDRLRIVATEYLRIQDTARQIIFNASANLRFIPSQLFDNPLYVTDITYCLFVLIMRSSGIPMINIIDMTEALLYVKLGSSYVTQLVLNMPDRCLEICQSLLAMGENQDEGTNFNDISEQRAKTLRTLCLFNPDIAFTTRAMCLQSEKMPSLTIMITLDQLKEPLNAYHEVVRGKDDSGETVDTSDNKMDVEESSSTDREKALENLQNSFDDAIAFITGTLLGDNEGTKHWFAQYLKLAQQKRIDQSHFTVLSEFRSQLSVYIKLLFYDYLEEASSLTNRENKTGTHKHLIRATAVLRLFCALRGIGALKLNTDESETLLRLVTCRPERNQTSVNFATTGVCTLLACSTMIGNQKEEKRAAEWLKWLIKGSNYSDSQYTSHGKCSISELLLLIAIHFQNNQTSQIADLVCATLGMKLQIKASVLKCKSLFVQEVFNDQMVAEHAVNVPVTKNLSNNMKEFLPIHCIHQLLEGRSFSKHQVPIKDWIYEQLCESRKPIHHMLPKLIEAYVHSILVSTSVHGYCGTNQAIPEEDIARIFKVQLYAKNHVGENDSANSSINSQMNNSTTSQGNEKKVRDVEVAQVLFLYYLLLYEEVRLRKNPELNSHAKSEQVKYSAEFMMEIPIYYLVQLVRENQDSLGLILPDLLKLVTIQYPQLCSIQHWLNFDNYEPVTSHNLQVGPVETELDDRVKAKMKSMLGLKKSTPLKTKSTPKESLDDRLSRDFSLINTEPLRLAKTLAHINSFPRDEIWPFVRTFINNWPRVLDLDQKSDENKKLIQVSTKLWWKFNTVFPRKLWVMTVNSFRKPQERTCSSVEVNSIEHSWDELVLDPLIVLRCDIRIFRCAPVLQVVLHVLDAFLAASKRCLQDHINEQPGRAADRRNLEELRATLVLAQTSAAIQILLESCMPTDEEQAIINKRDSEDNHLDEDETIKYEMFESSVSCICEHLHQVFIADINLAKLVHFQTYPSDLLATTSDKIPSMHICLDFIPELLGQPDLSKQVFVIELTSHLCEKYAITKSLNVAKLCFNVAHTLLQLLPSTRRASFFIPVLPALLKICKVFPILREDAEIILNQINQITLAHMASTSSRLCMSSSRPFEGLEKLSWREVKRLTHTLGLHEALYLNIQKCLLDLGKLKESDKRWASSQATSQQQQVYNTIFAYGNHVINPTGN